MTINEFHRPGLREYGFGMLVSTVKSANAAAVKTGCPEIMSKIPITVTLPCLPGPSV
jgi:hypothetical protein